MRILIIGRVERRDYAQIDMYKLIAKEHELYFSSGDDAFNYINNIDLLWLGIYHQFIDIDWPLLFARCNAPVIIDNADNEEFFKIRGKLPYQLLYKKVFTSRYLPNDSMEKVGIYFNAPVMQLTWYVSPERMMQNDDNIDFAFIATKDKRRERLMRDAETIAKSQGWSYAIGEYHGQDYVYNLSKTRVFYCDCERKCLTQKYLEAALSGCVLIGDVPIYPANNLKVIPAGINNLVTAYNEALQSKPPKWHSPFKDDFDKIIKYFNEAGR